MSDPSPQTRVLARWTGVFAAFAAVLMLGAAFAAVPLYRLFCAATGYGGAPQIAQHATTKRGEKVVNVHFDANIAPGLNWRFEPESPQISVRAGDVKTVYYKVTNLSDQPSKGIARYNIAPDQSAAYFNKLSCFCFTDQTLAAHETQELAVVFFLDPDLEKDEMTRNVDSITLSYTFFPSKKTEAGNENKSTDKNAGKT